MEKFVLHSLRDTIAKEMLDLNAINGQFYALMRKISTIGSQQSKIANQRLEDMRVDIKQRIRCLGNNIDLLYQNIDEKISIVISQLRSLPKTQSAQIKNNFLDLQTKNKDLQHNNGVLRGQNLRLKSENENLKAKNIQLFKQIEERSKNRKQEPTYDNSKELIGNLESSREISHNATKNFIDYTFRSPKKGYEVDKSLNFLAHKRLVQQQPFFSEMLIKEQNSSLQKIQMNSTHRQHKLAFGCLPKKVNILTLKGRESIRQSGNFDKKNEHRINFLLENLKQPSRTSSHQKSLRRNRSEGKQFFSNRLVQYRRI